MALTGILGTASSELGNFVLGYGASISTGKNVAAADSATAADAASSVLVVPFGVAVEAADSAVFADAAAVAFGYRNTVGWFGPGNLSAFAAPGNGFRVPRYLNPWRQESIALQGTAYFNASISREYRQTGLIVRIYWIGSPNAGFQYGVLGLAMWPALSGEPMASFVTEPSSAIPAQPGRNTVAYFTEENISQVPAQYQASLIKLFQSLPPGTGVAGGAIYYSLPPVPGVLGQWKASQAVQMPVSFNTIMYTDFNLMAPDPSGILAGSEIMVVLNFTPTGQLGIQGATYQARLPFVFLGAAIFNR